MYLLKACNDVKTFNHTRQQCLHVFHYKAKLTRSLCETFNNPSRAFSHKTTLTDGFQDTCHVLYRPGCHSAISWKAMISDHAARGKSKEALESYKCMLHAGFEPDASVYVSLLKACSNISDYHEGKNIHAELIQKGVASDLFVCHTLVSMYGKCWSIADAERVFGGLAYHNVVSWNVMLAAYVDTGNGKKALLLYRQMQEEGTHPNERTFVSVLQACCSKVESTANEELSISAYLEIGQALHSSARKMGFVKDIFIGCTLIRMYGKCGSLLQAESVFVKLSYCSVVAWNALLSAYIHQGEVKLALHVYRQMLKEGVSANERTFVVILQACFLDDADDGARFSHLKIGQAFHGDMRRQGYVYDIYIGSTLVSMYGKFGSIVEAESAFRDISHPNVLSWNAMLFAYVEQGEGKKALQLYRRMEEDGIYPNERSFELAVKACYLVDSSAKETAARSVYLKIGQALHAVVRRRGFALDSFIGSTLISMYARLKHIHMAENVFVGLSKHDVSPWTAMLSAYIEQGEGEKALQLYSQMQKEAMSLDPQTFVCTLQACSLLAEKEEAAVVEGRSIKPMCLELGRAIHIDAQVGGFTSHVYVSSTLVTMYGKCGSIHEAELVLNGFSLRNVVPWNAMLSAYLLKGQGESAIQLYGRLLKEDVTLDDVTLTCTLQACAEVGNVDVCRHTHFSLIFAALDLLPLLGNVVVHAYAMCASMLDAWAVLNGMLQADRVSWSALIDGYARQGHCRECHQAFEHMQHTGVKPDAITFLSLLAACNHEGLVNEGIGYFISMCVDYGSTPEAKHYVSLLDLLGRAGDLARVQHTLHHMPMQPNVATWMGLLGSCRTHGNMELGKWLFNQAVHLWPNEATAYILMSNICNDVGQG